MTEAVLALDQLVGSVVERYDGLLVQERGEGDSHFTVFDQCSRAVVACADLLAAVDARAWPGDLRLRMRAGVHLGEVDAEQGYYGTSINQAARLRALAHGGQAIASRVVADVAASHLPGDLSLESLGLHRVRDWPSPTEVFQICRPDLRQDFPPLTSEDNELPQLAAIAALDVVGSSRFARRANHAELVERHRTLLTQLREVFDLCGGRLFQARGDGCMACFESPDNAIDFARMAMDKVRSAGQGACIGIDYGPVEPLPGDFGGHAAYVAFELCGLAEPDTAVVSAVVHQLSTGAQAGLTSLGPMTLRSSSDPIETYRLDRRPIGEPSP